MFLGQRIVQRVIAQPTGRTAEFPDLFFKQDGAGIMLFQQRPIAGLRLVQGIGIAVERMTIGYPPAFRVRIGSQDRFPAVAA